MPDCEGQTLTNINTAIFYQWVLILLSRQNIQGELSVVTCTEVPSYTRHLSY